ncbi:MAG: hypothetical protein CPSOU_5505 [uncultured Paraburkholderia sp.]|nr:MAG: hypothetical protein CPSOU_5505 [uncultured Paraburkholderia sp.]
MKESLLARPKHTRDRADNSLQNLQITVSKDRNRRARQRAAMQTSTRFPLPTSSDVLH